MKIDVQELEELTPREEALLSEILRIEEGLTACRALGDDFERESYSLLLEQSEMIYRRLILEDDLLWAVFGRLMDQIRNQALDRVSSHSDSHENLMRTAYQIKGSELDDFEVLNLRLLADQMAEVNRLLTE